MRHPTPQNRHLSTDILKMKYLLYLSPLIALVSKGFAELSVDTTLFFSDQSRITGKTISLNPTQDTIQVTSHLFEQPTTLETKNLHTLVINNPKSPGEGDHVAVITLKKHFKNRTKSSVRNDTLKGNIIAVDENNIRLKTWYAGTFDIKRKFVENIEIFTNMPTLYAGPFDSTGWVSSDSDWEKKWQFDGRGMSTSRKIGLAREIEYPKRTSVSFTAEWKTQCDFKIHLYSEKGESRSPRKGYAINFERSYFHIQRVSPEGNREHVMYESINNLRNLKKANFEILLSRDSSETNAILMNGKVLETWTGRDDTGFKGKFLHFFSNGRSSIRFSNILVRKWDGTIRGEPKDGAKKKPQPKAKKQSIVLANEDIVEGKVNKVTDSIMEVSTSFGKILIPINRVHSFDISGKKDEIRMMSKDLRAHFPDGDYITIQPQKLNGKTLTAYSQAFGTLEFDIESFSRLEFDIWNKTLNSARTSTSTNW